MGNANMNMGQHPRNMNMLTNGAMGSMDGNMNVQNMHVIAVNNHGEPEYRADDKSREVFSKLLHSQGVLAKALEEAYLSFRAADFP